MPKIKKIVGTDFVIDMGKDASSPLLFLRSGCCCGCRTAVGRGCGAGVIWASFSDEKFFCLYI